MKFWIKSSILLGVLVFSPLAFTTTSVETTTPNKKIIKKSTEVSFEDVLVQGKYHFSDEAVTTVEQDKVLDALLSVRKDFKDRMKKSAERH